MNLKILLGDEEALGRAGPGLPPRTSGNGFSPPPPRCQAHSTMSGNTKNGVMAHGGCRTVFGASDVNPMRILIVDDDLISRTKLKVILDHFGRCEVKTGGREALAAVREAQDTGVPFDLICLDVQMPDLNG